MTTGNITGEIIQQSDWLITNKKSKKGFETSQLVVNVPIFHSKLFSSLLYQANSVRVNPDILPVVGHTWRKMTTPIENRNTTFSFLD